MMLAYLWLGIGLLILLLSIFLSTHEVGHNDSLRKLFSRVHPAKTTHLSVSLSDTPSLKPKLRVGLLLFGQPRNIHVKDVFESHKLHFLERYTVDTWAHMWWSAEESQQTYPVSTWAQNVTTEARVSDINAPEIVRQRYPGIHLEIEPSKTFTFSDEALRSVKQRWGDTMPWFSDHGQNRSNIISQLYSISSVTRSAVKHSHEYDYFILARYDHVIHEFPDLSNCDLTAQYISDHHPRFPDLIVGLPSAALPAWSQVFSFAETALLAHAKDMWEPSAECFKYQCMKNNWPGITKTCPMHLTRA